MSLAVKGASVNGSGTLVAAKFIVGKSTSSDDVDHVLVGNTVLPVKAAIEMGILTREAGSLQELNAPARPAAVRS